MRIPRDWRAVAAVAAGVIAACPASGLAQALPIGFASMPAECGANDSRIEVLLVGSYHMANPGQDAFNLETDDITTPRRQEEIQTLIDNLAAFRPTRVAIEAEYSDSTAWQSAYASFRSGERSLMPNEREQIGFRLADHFEHERIYPVDVTMPMNMSSLGPLADRNPAHGRRLEELQSFGQEAIRAMAGWLANGTVSDMLYRMNEPETLEMAHFPYALVVPIAEGEVYAGADVVSAWYQRNLRIFANVHRTIRNGEDRIFVVYGQGHVPLLRQFIIESPGLCFVDPLPFLVNPQ